MKMMMTCTKSCKRSLFFNLTVCEGCFENFDKVYRFYCDGRTSESFVKFTGSIVMENISEPHVLKGPVRDTIVYF